MEEITLGQVEENKQPDPIKRVGKEPVLPKSRGYNTWDKIKYAIFYGPLKSLINKVNEKHITHMSYLLGKVDFTNEFGQPVIPVREKSPIEKALNKLMANHPKPKIYNNAKRELPKETADNFVWVNQAEEDITEGNRIG